MHGGEKGFQYSTESFDFLCSDNVIFKCYSVKKFSVVIPVNFTLRIINLRFNKVKTTKRIKVISSKYGQNTLTVHMVFWRVLTVVCVSVSVCHWDMELDGKLRGPNGIF